MLLYAFVFLVLVLDQASKYVVLALLERGESVPVVSGLFHITLIHNTGAAFGMMKAHPRIFVVISILAVLFINYILIKKLSGLNPRERIALCLLLGGTLGNLADRIRLGYVTDFLDFRVWPVFNLADSFITAGAVLIAWSLLAGVRRSLA
ncbi:MAG: signal peptidase II [Candidatus Omnitrophica bacterium]|nr:signal peptidase II [Candidatus Omnitrophota bacterium]